MASLVTDVLGEFARHPEQVCLRYPVSGGEFGALTRAEAAALSLSTAAALDRAGIRPGHRVAVLTRDPVELAVGVVTLIGTGAVPVLVDGSLPLAVMRRCLAAAAPDAVLGEPLADLAGRLTGWGGRGVRRRLAVGAPVVWPGPSLDRLRRRVTPRRELTDPPDDATALIVFTSGATGPPKGVVHRHTALRAVARAFTEGLPPARELSVAAFAPAAFLGPLLGTTMVVPRLDLRRPARVRAHALAEAVLRTGAGTLWGSPALVDRLARHCHRTGTALPTLRHILSFGATLPYPVLDRVRGCLPDVTVHSVYGATEALPVSAIDHHELLALRPATVGGHGVCLGRPLPGVEVRVLPPDHPAGPGAPGLRCGAVGELAVTGEYVSSGYLDPAATRAAKERGAHGEVVHRTGDAGHLDEQGRIWFHGRLAHRVPTTDGELFTERVEPVLEEVPGVRRVALVGVASSGDRRPVVVVECERSGPGRAEVRRGVRKALADGAGGASADLPVLFHRSLPVDHRHGAKIDRARLARWAAPRVSWQ
ncbi:AMP-binding protein [Streptomyces griseocarneus]|uniref:AMP-binding protein n=1 Tax=Streptomyces griseocarneus TaxID=51201 RepID=UPI00167CC63D|nr:AMP-binding protein [Streptomyces griseocarneus]MBZ6475157.1 AMP-binding protein [Streptomyces griseocarneus]GHG61938.1 peptide synthase [Streptomyces griseocarneus]